MVDLNLDALFKIKHKGQTYKRIKTFRDERKAEAFVEELKERSSSKRFQPLIEEAYLGRILGLFFRTKWLYRVCIPKNMKV